MEQNLITVISSGLAVFVLVIFYFWFYKQYQIDRSRQELFALRDELFDYAADGNINFDHPAYIFLRQTMNGMIRFTHRVDILTIFGVLFVKVTLPTEPDSFQRQFQEALLKIESEEKRKKLLHFSEQMNLIIIGHIIKSSIIAFFLAVVFLVVIIVCMLIVRGLTNLKAMIANKFPGINQIDTLASKIGQAA